MTTTILISPHLIRRFNEAASLARAGDFEASLAVWEHLLNPTDEDKSEGPRVLTGEFLGQAYMRKAWVLMDLGRHQAAREVFEDPVMRACLPQFDMPVLYDYFFSYANTLGNLGAIEPMDDAFTRAMNAASKLGDARRMYQCWHNLLAWAEGAAEWEYLDVQTEICLQYAANVGDAVLTGVAELSRAMALAQLGGKDEVRAIVLPILARARAGGLENLIERAEQILRVVEN
ncbi:MAG: hypothetical protein H6839_01335 [Planctomycetes bacterium]|nr:hypothetical protein [Planctomycetota bacterium]